MALASAPPVTMIRNEVRSAYAAKFAGGVLQCGLIGGGPKGVLGVILSYV